MRRKAQLKKAYFILNEKKTQREVQNIRNAATQTVATVAFRKIWPKSNFVQGESADTFM
jgi:hypothetical protein